MKPSQHQNNRRPENRFCRQLAIGVSLVFAAGALNAADWPQFRGPRSNGSGSEQTLPASFDANKDLAWKADLPGRGLSSPIILGDRLFVTCCSGPKEQKLHVLCLNALTGARLWERQFNATGRTVCQSKMSVAANTPASDGKHIVVIFSSNDAACLDPDGNLLWYRGLGRDYPNAADSLGMASSPVISGGVAVTQVESESDGFVVGLDLETGVNRWKIDRPHLSNWTSPILWKNGNSELAILAASKSVVAMDPATGKSVWELPELGSSIPSATEYGGVIFVPSKRGLTALRPGTAGEKPEQLWQSAKLRPGTPSPVVVGDKILTLTDAGILSCGAIATGEIQWQARLKGPFSATPVASGNFVYCANESGVVQTVDTSKPDGEVVSELKLDETIMATPSIAHGSLYLRSDAHIWRFGRGEPKP